MKNILSDDKNFRKGIIFLLNKKKRRKGNSFNTFQEKQSLSLKSWFRKQRGGGEGAGFLDKWLGCYISHLILIPMYENGI